MNDALSKKVAELEAEIARLREALESMVRAFGRQARAPLRFDPSDADHEAVAALGAEIGYGNLMEIASGAWRARLEADGNPVGGEFAVGTCIVTAGAAVALARAALREPGNG